MLRHRFYFFLTDPCMADNGVSHMQWQWSQVSIQFLHAQKLQLVTSVRWTQQLPELSVFQANRITIATSLPPNVSVSFVCSVYRRYRHPSQDSVLRTDWAVGGSYCGRDKRCSLLRNCSGRFNGPPKLLFFGYRGSLPGTKRPGRDVLAASSVKVKNEWTDNFACFLSVSNSNSLHTVDPTVSSHQSSKRHNNTITDLDRSWGFQEAEAPKFQENRCVKLVRMSALRTGRL